jgi:hypothetical protein
MSGEAALTSICFLEKRALFGAGQVFHFIRRQNVCVTKRARLVLSHIVTEHPLILGNKFRAFDLLIHV